MELIEEQDSRRDVDLVPVRHGRMGASPFTFYRGAANIMAGDLDRSPTAGLEVQLCGDAHLSNFGVFGSPERRLVFDINDFDETLPGPFEYDVKRLAASITVAAHNNGFSTSEAKAVTRSTVASYRKAMGKFAKMRTLEVWYAHLSEDELTQATRQAISALDAGNGRGAGKDKGKGAAKKPRSCSGASRRTSARHTLATVFKHSRSSRRSSTGGTGSPALRRSSSLPASSTPPTGSTVNSWRT